MTDVPPAPFGSEDPSAYVPSGQRRSTFSPPPEGTEPPTWDDDALAAAMEEEVRPYTSPITLPVLPPAARRPTPDPQPVAPPAPQPAPTPEPQPAPTPQPEPQPEPAPELPEPKRAPEPQPPQPAPEPEPQPEPAPVPEPVAPSVPQPAPAPASPPAPVAPPAPTATPPDHIAVDPFTDPAPADDEQLARDLEGAPTLDAMQRLEEELRRRAAGAPADELAPTPSFFEGAPPVSLEPPGPDPELHADHADGPEPARQEPADQPDPGPESAPDIDIEPDSAPDVDPLSIAPPPVYTPPTLVEPAAPAEQTEPVARLLPPPTDVPDIAFRAELPPPPGYAEDGTPAPAPRPAGVDEGGPDPAPDLDAAPDSAPKSDSEPDPEILAPVAIVSRFAPLPSDWDGLLAAVPEPAAPAAVAPHPPVPPTLDLAAADDDRVGPILDEDDDRDVIDPGDRIIAAGAFGAPAGVVDEDVDGLPAPGAPEAVTASPDDEVEPRLPSATRVETAGIEPTPRAQRAGRAARLFWLWFAANASVVSVALGAVMIGTGMSLRQAIVATVIGIALSFIPLGFTTLAGKWSGQPTMVVSRSVFGTGGNVLPTVLAVLVRVFWGGVLLWLLGDALGTTLVRAGSDAGLGATRWALIGAAVGAVLALVVAAVGYGLLARVQLVLSIVTGAMIVGAAAVTLPQVHLDVALTHQDGSWLLVIGGAVLVFAFVGLAWAFSGSDVARYQRIGGSGASSMLWATFGATIPPFLLIGWGALLAASNPRLATGFATHPLATIAEVLPSWYAVPLLVAAGVGLLSGSVLTLYSGGFALQNLTPLVPRAVGVIVTALLALAAAAGLVLLGADTRSVVSDLAVTLAVPIAAWAGLFAAEMMIRNRRFHTPSLLAPGGVYPRARWVNLVGLIVISGVGYAFVRGGASWLDWQGFGWRLLGVGTSQPIANVDLGVLIALALGLLLPLVAGVPAIRRQEAAQPGEATART